MLNDKALKDDDTLNLITGNNSSATLTQRKAEVWEIKDIKSDPEKEDEVSLEKGVAIMSCGHCFSRNSMIGLINMQLDDNRTKITCPTLKEDGLLCCA